MKRFILSHSVQCTGVVLEYSRKSLQCVNMQNTTVWHNYDVGGIDTVTSFSGWRGESVCFDAASATGPEYRGILQFSNPSTECFNRGESHAASVCYPKVYCRTSASVAGSSEWSQSTWIERAAWYSKEGSDTWSHPIVETSIANRFREWGDAAFERNTCFERQHRNQNRCALLTAGQYLSSTKKTGYMTQIYIYFPGVDTSEKNRPIGFNSIMEKHHCRQKKWCSVEVTHLPLSLEIYNKVPHNGILPEEWASPLLLGTWLLHKCLSIHT